MSGARAGRTEHPSIRFRSGGPCITETGSRASKAQSAILEEMRFRAIEAHQAGKGVAEIAKLLGVHWGSVSRWLTKWRRDGQRGFKERKATGRPPKLDCKRHGKAILKLVKHPATEYGFEHPLWTCQRIRG